jgi:hypothetical protein
LEDWKEGFLPQTGTSKYGPSFCFVPNSIRGLLATYQLKILRQLVELQLCHNTDIKTTIDRAWGVTQNKHKKKDSTTAPPDPDDPRSQEKLQLIPVGQDSLRKRYWVADGPCEFFQWIDRRYLRVFTRDGNISGLYRSANIQITDLSVISDSPRIYVSTNPWKTTATFQTISSTRDEYIAAIEQLRESAPHVGERRSKLEQSHSNLITALEGRKEAVDVELMVSFISSLHHFSGKNSQKTGR